MNSDITNGGRLAVDAAGDDDVLVAQVRGWVDRFVPSAWRTAAQTGPEALRAARPAADYRAWYPVFGRSGLVAPTWRPEYGGLGLDRRQAELIEAVLAPYKLYRLNPLGLNNAAAALFRHGTEEQRLRFLPSIVDGSELWCQLFSEPGAGSDLASLATRAVRTGDEWVVTGQKVWTTWADEADFAVLLARTDPDVPKHAGITYFVLDMRQPGVEVRPLRQITGEAEFNEVFLDEARVPDTFRLGEVGDGWRVSASTLSSERAMVSGGGSGGIGRLGGSGVDRLIEVARQSGQWQDPTVRHRVMALWTQERAGQLTNARVRATVEAGQAPGPAASVGKVHQATLNQQIQGLLLELLGTAGICWDAAGPPLPRDVRGMLRSLANSTEGGTTDINKNIIGERVLGLPREPDPWKGRPWSEVPRS